MKRAPKNVTPVVNVSMSSNGEQFVRFLTGLRKEMGEIDSFPNLLNLHAMETTLAILRETMKKSGVAYIYTHSGSMVFIMTIVTPDDKLVLEAYGDIATLDDHRIINTLIGVARQFGYPGITNRYLGDKSCQLCNLTMTLTRERNTTPLRDLLGRRNYIPSMIKFVTQQIMEGRLILSPETPSMCFDCEALLQTITLFRQSLGVTL